MLSIIIPSRNEKYLNKTLMDLKAKAEGRIEIIVILEGYWEKPVEGVKYIHRGKARGMRSAINSAVAMASGEYLMKTDAHCMFDQGFDVKLIADHSPKWVQVPRRKRLDPEKWEIIVDGRTDIDYEEFDENLKGKKNDKKAKERKEILIDDIMTFQGSCWFMKKDFFHELGLMDEKWSSFWHEATEITLKAWQVGHVKVNKKTWYAHWHKNRRGYNLDKKEQALSQGIAEEHREEIKQLRARFS